MFLAGIHVFQFVFHRTWRRLLFVSSWILVAVSKPWCRSGSLGCSFPTWQVGRYTTPPPPSPSSTHCPPPPRLHRCRHAHHIQELEGAPKATVFPCLCFLCSTIRKHRGNPLSPVSYNGPNLANIRRANLVANDVNLLAGCHWGRVASPL